jgi:hypothetical protein
MSRPALTLALLASLALVGCGDKPMAPPAVPTVSEPAPSSDDADIQAERAKLSPEDRVSVEAQDYCAINNKEGRLGSMGPPIKVEIKGETVFLCCAGCRKQALAHPDETLATVAQLKAKVKAAKSATGP